MIVFKTFDISQLFSEHTEHTNGLIGNYLFIEIEVH